ncbi:DUF1236 domain-containing protein [Amorphus orientalis]|uniref:DUF1236 domain-containing protein n=1 Tax=Amorphus orientalis TaxID=649198 RepID=A0AAE4ARJ8_9HYPH|nr:DUF1236 domain-containing protein [Amorphus orientalis]MDQ0314143.1 hypothetical protein [Amorphus orientalis]
MNKVFTIASAAAIAVATAGAPALAQDSTVTGVAGGAATGAVVAGPPGAVIGAIAGGTIGASMDQAEQASEPKAHVVKDVPSEVGAYTMQRPAPETQLNEPVRIGDPLPQRVEVREVPDYPQYAYANINGQNVVVDAETGEVIGVVQQ